MDYAEINVDHQFHRHLIGKNGANINRIKDLYKVYVCIPPDNEKSNLIRIEGDPQGVQQAKKELLELASHMENEHTKDLIVEQKFHQTIIGQKEAGGQSHGSSCLALFGTTWSKCSR
ncbi:vigilin-like [Falco naumanni]|uniref:vigilin-like n=1 Tax=Falco naumanni TaxID=148594 RepID=UPI001ADEAE53|nr:vigilin-like [Falco naumanni]